MELIKSPINKTIKRPSIEEHFIVAVGASSERLPDIHTFFKDIPNDAISYVVAQPSSADCSKLMAGLRTVHPQRDIYKVEEGMHLRPNGLYVLPEDKPMVISNGKFRLNNEVYHTPVSTMDILFNSLAEEKGSDSIGVLLAGAGSEGKRGIAAIKEKGGMVIIQNLESAETKDITSGLIESGNFDFALSPDLMQNQISYFVKQRVLNHKYLNLISENEEASILEVIGLIKEHTPLDFTHYKRPTIVRRIIKRMVTNEMGEIGKYIHFLKSSPAEIDLLSREFLIKVTSFFRDPEAFEELKKRGIPEIVNNKLNGETLKLWVVGCATGEEAYSIAILIDEYLSAINREIKVKILATDIDKEALTFASKGRYPESIAKELSEERLRTYFSMENGYYKVKEKIRDMIVFAEHDITQNSPYGKIDLISCRNLIIYFNQSLQEKIFSIFQTSLNNGAYLFLGSCEGHGALTENFEVINQKWKMFQYNHINRQIDFKLETPPLSRTKSYVNTQIAMKPFIERMPDKISQIINASHLEVSGYDAGVCVNEDSEILMPFGEYEKFMLPKLFNTHLMELLPDSLAMAVETSLQKNKTSGKKVVVEHIKYPLNKKVQDISILVNSLKGESESEASLFMIYFRDDTNGNTEDTHTEVYNIDEHTKRYIEDLEEELNNTKHQLKDAHNALDTSHQNIQTYTEELLATNEELQSSNEELQSTNEELNVVNRQCEATIKELSELNDDFDNYFKSTINTQVYVDKDLCIKMFTPSTVKQINVKESDIGRPLADLSNNIKETDLIQEVLSVIQTQKLNKKQIETKDGMWYVMVIMPYIRSKDRSVDGAIITFYDITDLKKSQEIIEQANTKLMKINEDHDTFIYSVSHDLKSPLNSMEGLITILKASDDIEQVKAITVPLVKSVIKLRETIDELSNITNIEKEIEEAGNVDVKELVEEVKWSIRDLLESSHAILEIELNEKEIKFSKKNLRSILYNLLCNAIKYRSNNRQLKIVVKTQKIDGFTMLSIQDNGIGISDGKIGEIFSKFKRIHEHNAGIEGSGIGLYLVNKIVSNAGGEIKVESTLEKGTTFKVLFPNK
ncbi:PAS domain-containing protein [Marivirga sp. S37H4]|uniref:histidine kinase n=1 Tax=Marivirga aurantiaca TaxID=2802615 RepID=A0A934X0A7_9BACT|nr:CheR family methyltransferase [Marivirga aurantiaca]MBK6266151.1 PAS domain-containing protein [Marivirga aurantiaca]